MKSKSIKILIILILLISVASATFLVYAYFFQQGKKEEEKEIGKVDAEIIAYYDNGVEREYIDIEDGFGVVELNISDPTKLNHFNNFRVDVKVNSNIDTYIRLAVFEQFTLTYETAGIVTRVAITKDEYSPFNYNNTLFYDNRLKDDYFYYKDKVKDNITNDQIISLIGPYYDSYPIYEAKYSIMLGFVIEAVQAHLGPINNWGINNPPWNPGIDW